MLRPRRHQPRGFTLIELLIAMAVMLIGLLALWGLHAAAITSNANAYRLGISTILAQDLMEQIYAETWMLSYANPDLDTTLCGGLFPPAATDGLETLPCSLDNGLRVNGLGNTDATLGPVMFLRSYHLELFSGGPTIASSSGFGSPTTSPTPESATE
jgi:prepilin-type N-terminal cleavage/methylation domain-containing protein